MNISKSKAILGVRFLAILIAALALSCAKSDEEKAEGAVSKKPQEEVVPVEVQTVERSTVTETISAVGMVEAWHDVAVSAEASGKVIEVRADEGDAVKKGSVIVRLDDELAALGVAQAEAQVAMARANAAKMKRDLRRAEELFGTKDISESRIEEVRLGAETAEAALQSAEVALKMGRRQLADTQVRSPINGKVAVRRVDVGEMVAPGAPVATVVDLSRVNVRIMVSETEIAKFRVGQKAHLTVAAYPNERFEGKVSKVGLKADFQTRSFSVEIVVARNPDERLKAGMIARAEVEVRTYADVLLIPQDAVLDRSGEKSVYVVGSDKAAKRSLILGRRWDEQVVVERGLNVGDRLVVAGHEKLSEGTKVEVGNQPEPE
jgi:RND family efflux transporter MFP subunit